MPPAIYQGGADLRIELDGIDRVYPGSVITGRVVRATPEVSPRATVTVRLLGRAKTKITVKRSNGQTTSTHHYRNRFNFFEPTQTRQKLFDGTLHIAPGASSSTSWPFALDVPLSPSSAALRSGDVESCFVPLTPEQVSSSRLPASFAAEGRHHNTRFEAYVEYHLEAMLITSGSHGKSLTATLPIRMYAPPQQTLSNFQVIRRSLGHTINTYRLVPGMENAELSFKQKTQQLFGSSKVPVFGFALQVDCPQVIQLGGSTPIPFSMRIIPDRSRTSEIVRDVDQIVTLTSLEFVLKAHTAVVAPGTFSPKNTSDVLKHHIYLPVTALAQTVSPPAETAPDEKGNIQPTTSVQRPRGLFLPSKWEAGDDTALNIGEALEFQLFPTHATALGRSIARTSVSGIITPGFNTYCIRHSHSLKWKAVLNVAGKTVDREGEQPIRILGPSEPAQPPGRVSQQPSQLVEELPPYGPSSSSGGLSNTNGPLDVPVVEELPEYTKS